MKRFEDSAPSIQHVDVSHREAQDRDYAGDFTVALRNMEQHVNGDLPEKAAVHFAHRLAHVLGSERDRRDGHYMMYKMMTKVAIREPLFSDNVDLPVVSLLDLDRRTSGLDDSEIVAAQIYNNKGISAELGHVDQLGNWGAAKPLDAAIRQLPESDELAAAGFVFDETYDAKEAAKIGYRFNVVDGNNEVLFKATRRRAAADITTVSGETYEIVKLSSFLINPELLSQDGLRWFHEVQRYGGQKTAESAKAFDNAGNALIEPYLTDKTLQADRADVLAVTSLYFALRRHR